jgi:SAM-dependent methyltransferase
MSDVKRLIAESYDASATGYARHADPLVYAHLAEPLAHALRAAPGLVLDVAGGAGALARLLPRPVVYDLVHAQLVRNPTDMRVQGDAEALPFASNAFAAAGCAFGINHFPHPEAAVTEMARVAPLVGVLTWELPLETHYKPREIVLDVLARHAGRSHTEAGEHVERMGAEVGSEQALRRLLTGAGLVAAARRLEHEVPWPGAEAFVDYRLSMGASKLLDDLGPVRKEAIAALEQLPARELEWSARLVLGLGRRA